MLFIEVAMERAIDLDLPTPYTSHEAWQVSGRASCISGHSRQ